MCKQVKKQVKIFYNNCKIGFTTGKMDSWLVYQQDQDGHVTYPKDTDYFAKLQAFSKIYPPEKLYNDFIAIYDKTKENVDTETLQLIDLISSTYPSVDQLSLNILFSTLYLTMIAEENKKNTKLGKRIKRLGVYFTLIERKPPEIAATCLNGKNAGEISQLCIDRNF